ncbi:MAG: efflux RND transporter periplasmic adaptor subunit [Acidobacteria bacterium]|nr:MAG: efflux RND transporter periplasmic adaptor subunit [Acidobacteriota bacterium]
MKMCVRPATLAFALITSLSLASCSREENQSGRAASLSPEGQTAPTVEVTRVISEKLQATVLLPAELVPYEQVEVYSKVTGFVKWIKVDRGSRVKKGELIAELDAPELVAQRAEADSKYQSAESQLAAAKARLAADEGTYQRLNAAARTAGVVAPNDLDIAEKAVESDQGNVSALEKTAQAAQESLRAVGQLESYLDITAPFDGEITTRFVHPGALVGPAGGPGAVTPIVRVETITRGRLVVPVPEYDVAGVPEGAEVAFTVPAFPGKVFHAPIARISHSVDVKTRTMPIELDVRDPGAELVPGSFSEVEWPLRRTYPTLFVPASAVATNLERTFVVRIRNGMTEWVDVKPGATMQGRIEVFGDLRPGDMVAIRGTDELRPGTAVVPHSNN